MTETKPPDGRIESMTVEDAQRITEEIRTKIGDIADIAESVTPLIVEAYRRQAHKTLGYDSWEAYYGAEFGDVIGRFAAVGAVSFRRDLVSDLAKRGLSTRAIAPVVGADHSTVVRDLRSSGADAPVGSPAKIIGINGKTYQHRAASQPAGTTSVRDQLAPYQNARRQQPATPPSTGPVVASRTLGTNWKWSVHDALEMLSVGVARVSGLAADPRLPKEDPETADFLWREVIATIAKLDGLVDILDPPVGDDDDHDDQDGAS